MHKIVSKNLSCFSVITAALLLNFVVIADVVGIINPMQD